MRLRQRHIQCGASSHVAGPIERVAGWDFITPQKQAAATASFRETLNLAEESERTRLAELVQHGNCTSIQSRDFNFDDVFRKLTGQEFT